MDEEGVWIQSYSTKNEIGIINIFNENLSWWT